MRDLKDDEDVHANQDEAADHDTSVNQRRDELDLNEGMEMNTGLRRIQILSLLGLSSERTVLILLLLWMDCVTLSKEMV